MNKLRTLLLVIMLLLPSSSAVGLSICDSGDGNCTRAAVNTNTSLSTRSGLTNASSAGDEATVPIGTIVAWTGVKSMDAAYELGKWLECDGRDIDRAKYPKLWDMFPDHKTPNLSGRFLRGKDAGHKTLDKGEDSIQSHTSSVEPHGHKFEGKLSSDAVATDIINHEAKITASVTADGTSKAEALNKSITMKYKPGSYVEQQTYEIKNSKAAREGNDWAGDRSDAYTSDGTRHTYQEAIFGSKAYVASNTDRGYNHIVKANKRLGYYQNTQWTATCYHWERDSSCGCAEWEEEAWSCSWSESEFILDMGYQTPSNFSSTDPYQCSLRCTFTSYGFVPAGSCLDWEGDTVTNCLMYVTSCNHTPAYCKKYKECYIKYTHKYWGPEASGKDAYATTPSGALDPHCGEVNSHHNTKWIDLEYLHNDISAGTRKEDMRAYRSELGGFVTPQAPRGIGTFHGTPNITIVGEAKGDMKFKNVGVEGTTQGTIAEKKITFAGSGNVDNNVIEWEVENSRELKAEHDKESAADETAPKHTYVRYFIRARN